VSSSDVNRHLTFQQLLNTLSTRLHSSVVKNLSVPIAFVCLLHLANDKVTIFFRFLCLDYTCFPVTYAQMGKLPTCCGLVIDTANKSVTSRCNGIWETTRHNRQNGLLLAPTCSGFIVYVTDLLRTCYREAGVMDFGFNCQKLYVHIIMSFVEFHYFQG